MRTQWRSSMSLPGFPPAVATLSFTLTLCALAATSSDVDSPLFSGKTITPTLSKTITFLDSGNFTWGER